MTNELQQLADALAQRLGWPLVVEDRNQRLLAYTQHPEPLDAVRQGSILSRHASPAVVSFLSRFRIHHAEGPVRTPGCEELGMLPRVCVPVRHNSLLLGFLWFVEDGRSMTDTELETASAAGQDFALTMYRENLAHELATQRESEAVRDLLAPAPEIRAHATRTLIGDGHLASEGGFAAVVCAPALGNETQADDRLRLALEQALIEMRRRLGPRNSLHHLRHDHGLLVIGESPDARDTTDRYAAELHDLLAATTRDLSDVAPVPVGVGGHCARLDQVARSYEQAWEAAHVAQHMPLEEPIANWDRLGLYRALVHLDGSEVDSATIHPGLAALLDHPHHEELVVTLETYLNLAGNAQQTAQQLFVHRATLYHRLRRIEEIACTDLRDGDERLSLHLALKLGRLAGRLSERPEPPAQAV